MQTLKNIIESLLPRSLYRALLAPYHFAWTYFSAARYGFPARRLVVIGVTGTKGKSSVTEMIASMLTEAGHTVAVSSTIHFSIGSEVRPNKYKMTLPGRGFIQKFLAEAVQKGATHAVIEITSEAALQYRHLFLSLDALVFTNLEKEHIESHGSFENYFQAKYRIGTSLLRSKKRPRAIIATADSEYGKRFLELAVEKQLPFSLDDARGLTLSDNHIVFTYHEQNFSVPQPGNFSAMNALATIRVGEFLQIPLTTTATALGKLSRIAGRAERIEEGQDFIAIVDYAHTPESLKALYSAYESHPKICVLGNTGGGRDTWKRPLMGSIAEEMCETIILTDEDPYDEDPESILKAMASGMKKEPRMILDRREAIRTALQLAKPGDAVLVTGKGTDPYIMRAHGAKEEWSDSAVVREELKKLLSI